MTGLHASSEAYKFRITAAYAPSDPDVSKNIENRQADHFDTVVPAKFEAKVHPHI